MRQFLVVTFFILFPFAATAQVTGGTTDQSARMIAGAEASLGGISAQSELAQAYYFGLKGLPENRAEAYYWFSVCVYSAQNAKGFSEAMKNLEEVAEQIAKENPSKNYQEGRLMQTFLVDPFVKRLCEDFVTVLKKELPSSEKQIAESRLQDWIARHPPPVAQQMTPEQRQKADLTRRLNQGMNEGSDILFDAEGLKKLLSAGAEIKSDDLLLKAVSKKRADIAEVLIQAGLNDKNLLQKALGIAMEKGDEKAISLLIRMGRVPDDTMLSKGLRSAILAEDNALIDELIKLGAKMNSDVSLLSQLVSGKKIAMIKKYIELGGEVNFPIYNNGHPLYYVAKDGGIEILDILTNAGAKVDIVHLGSGETPLGNAVYFKNIEIVKRLLELGASPQTPKGVAKLMELAIESKSSKIIDFLLGQGFSFTEQQKAVLAMCPFEEKECPSGKKSFKGPPTCNFDICIPPERKSGLVVPVDHPSNQKNIEAFDILLKGTSEQKNEVIKKVIANSGEYNPNILNQLANVLFYKYRDEEGIFWRLAAELRSQGDIKICPSSAPSWVHDRNLDYSASFTFQYYKRREPERILEAIKKVIEWDAKTPYNYNIQWGLEPSTCVAAERHSAIRGEIRRFFRPAFMQEGKTPMEDQDNRRMDDLLPLAESGDVKAQVVLANCYAHSYQCRVHATDTVRVVADRVAQEKAQAGQSSMTFKALNLEQEYKPKALYWYEKAMSQGSQDAAAALTFGYYGGDFVPKDQEKARNMALSFLEKGYSNAFFLMSATSPPEEGKRDVTSLAWQMVAEAAGKGQGFSPVTASWYKTSLSDQDMATAKAKAEEYKAKYLPLFGSKKDK